MNACCQPILASRGEAHAWEVIHRFAFGNEHRRLIRDVGSEYRIEWLKNDNGSFFREQVDSIRASVFKLSYALHDHPEFFDAVDVTVDALKNSRIFTLLQPPASRAPTSSGKRASSTGTKAPEFTPSASPNIYLAGHIESSTSPSLSPILLTPLPPLSHLAKRLSLFNKRLPLVFVFELFLCVCMGIITGGKKPCTTLTTNLKLFFFPTLQLCVRLVVVLSSGEIVR